MPDEIQPPDGVPAMPETVDGWREWFDENVADSERFFEHTDEMGEGGFHLPLSAGDRDFAEGVEALVEFADLQPGIDPDDLDWGFEFSRLGADKKAQIHRGFYGLTAVPLAEEDLGRGGWFGCRARPCKLNWRVAAPVGLALTIGLGYAGYEVLMSDDAPLVLELDAPSGDDTFDETLGDNEVPQPDDTADETPGVTPGTYTFSAQAMGDCEEFTGHFRMRLFLNGSVDFGQLFTAGGNAFASATGLWNDQGVVATQIDPDIYQVFIMSIRGNGILGGYNVWGRSSPVLTDDAEANSELFEGVDGLEDLRKRFIGPGDLEDVCAMHLEITDSTFAEFPQASG